MNKVTLSMIVVMIAVAISAIAFLLLPDKEPAIDWTGVEPGAPTPPPADSPAPPMDTPLAPVADKPPAPQPTADPARVAQWEETISNALADDSISNQEAVKRLLALSYNTKVDEQIRLDALEHSLNLSEDEEFGTILPLLKDKNTPVEMLDSALNDLYNRGDRVKLESLLEVAKVPDHPLHEDAVELLEFYVDENFGDDWNAWTDALNTYFADNEVE